MDKQKVVVQTYNKILSTLIRKEILIHSTTHMKLENIKLSEMSQTQRTNII